MIIPYAYWCESWCEIIKIYVLQNVIFNAKKICYLYTNKPHSLAVVDSSLRLFRLAFLIFSSILRAVVLVYLPFLLYFLINILMVLVRHSPSTFSFYSYFLYDLISDKKRSAQTPMFLKVELS